MSFRIPEQLTTFRGRPFYLIQKPQIKFDSTTGILIDFQERLDTHVRGGGSVYRGSGSISINSSNLLVQKLWLKFEGERENCIELSNFNVDARIGQKITLLTGHRQGDRGSVYVAVYNHTTKTFFYRTNIWKSLLRGKGGFVVFILCVLIGLFLPVALMLALMPLIFIYSTSPSSVQSLISHVVFLSPILFWIVCGVAASKSEDRLYKDFSRHVKQIFSES